MKIETIKAGITKDSKKRNTIVISINNCITSSPGGVSTGKHEKPSYKKTLNQDISTLKKINLFDLEFNKFEDLERLEKRIKNKVGANTLYALEASILKALAKSKNKQLYQILGNKRKPKLLSNTVGGGVHSHLKKQPDFQEFLIIGDKKQNQKFHKETGKIIKAKSKDDENAWQTTLEHESILELMSWTGLDIGLDIAASEFYKKGKYCPKNKNFSSNKNLKNNKEGFYHYKNPKLCLTRKQQIDYIIKIIKKYKLKYVEDPLQEDDFKGFKEILKKTKNCLIVGDDLTTTNLERVKKAIKMKSINGLIVKPNQIGSLIEMKKVIDLCKKKKVKIIVSHRGGETMDDTIADFAVGFGADMLKVSVVGKERLAKVKRLERIS